MKLATTEYALLGMLSIALMTGYELKQFAEGTIGFFWRESFGQIYPALGRLARGGYIREVVAKKRTGKKSAAAGRERRVFELTKEGRRMLAEWMPEACREQVPRNELLLKLFFGAEAPVMVSRAHLQKQAEKARARMAEYEKIGRELQRMRGAPAPDGPRVVWWEMTLRRGIVDTRAELEWCKECLRTMKALDAHRVRKGEKGKKRARGREGSKSAGKRGK